MNNIVYALWEGTAYPNKVIRQTKLVLIYLYTAFNYLNYFVHDMVYLYENTTNTLYSRFVQIIHLNELWDICKFEGKGKIAPQPKACTSMDCRTQLQEDRLWTWMWRSAMPWGPDIGLQRDHSEKGNWDERATGQYTMYRPHTMAGCNVVGEATNSHWETKDQMVTMYSGQVMFLYPISQRHSPSLTDTINETCQNTCTMNYRFKHKKK